MEKSIKDYNPSQEPKEIREVLEYWFNGNRQIPTKREMNMWFYRSKDYDDEIREKFLELHTNLDPKKYNKTLAGLLAIVVIYDQLSRHIYRNTRFSFENDKKALKITKKFIEDYKINNSEILEEIILSSEYEFHIKHFLFMMMPLQHSEEMADQMIFKNIWDKMHKILRNKINQQIEDKTKINRSKIEISDISKNENRIIYKKYEKIEKFINNVLGHSEGHINRLKQFGRFPKRNEVLERKNTQEEENFLKSNKNGHY